MSKRKASDDAVSEPDPKREVAAAASISTATLVPSSTFFADEARHSIAAVGMVLQRVRHSSTLAALLQNRSKKSSVDLMTALAKTLAEDAQRPQPLIDLNHKLTGGGTLLMQLIETLHEHTSWRLNASDNVIQEKKDAHKIFLAQLPHVLQLVRLCDVSLLLSRDGETALNLLCRKSHPNHVSSWSHRFAEALLLAGADVSCRDQDGYIPLHSWTLDSHESACGPLLLLRHGAQLDAQTSDEGSTMLHLLVRSAREQKQKMLPMLRELAEAGYLALADFTLLNNAGQTALQAAETLVEEQPDDDAASEVLQTLFAQSSMWKEHIRDGVFKQLRAYLRPCDDTVMDPANLAHIILAYVDGQERPSETQAAASSPAAGMEAEA